jgi:presenilin-like A22 family membrane protease
MVRERGFLVKHTLPITLIVVVLFLGSQYLGLAIVNSYIDHQTTQQTGNLTVYQLPAVAGMAMDRPELEEKTSFLYIFAAVVIGTILILILIKYALNLLWKAWFFLATTLCMAFAFFAFLRQLPHADIIVTVIAAALALWKIVRPNLIVHNITELFIYGGLAAIFFPHISIWAAFGLLVLISLYDMYAVWRSKHMVTLATYQSDNQMFAGLSIPYTWPRKALAKAPFKTERKGAPKAARGQVKTAVLGGGDMGFPLLFAAAVLTTSGFLAAAVIPIFAALGLLILLLLAKNDRFYPAMPFISLGCLVGWLVSLLL